MRKSIYPDFQVEWHGDRFAIVLDANRVPESAMFFLVWARVVLIPASIFEATETGKDGLIDRFFC